MCYSCESANIEPRAMMVVVHSMNHEATMSGTKKVRVLPLSSRGTFLVLKVRIDTCRLYPDTIKKLMISAFISCMEGPITHATS
jgi:hypothetical protein